MADGQQGHFPAQRLVLQNETSEARMVGTFRLLGLLEGDCVYVSRTSTPQHATSSDVEIWH